MSGHDPRSKVNPDADMDAVAWWNSRPPAVRAFLSKYPPGMPVLVDGVTHYLCGASTVEDEVVAALLSPVDPRVDYERSYAARFEVCLGCFEGRCQGGHQ